MSDLFRYTITKEADNDFVFLKDAIKHVSDYLEIMKMRFGDRLSWHVSLPPEYELVRVPKLIIQPLVENAILHGAGNKLGNCFISVAIEPVKYENQERIRISVQDNGPGIEKERLEWIIKSLNSGGISSEKGNGMALSNVYKRLMLYFNKEYLHSSFSIESKLNEFTRISFEVPITKGE